MPATTARAIPPNTDTELAGGTRVWLEGVAGTVTQWIDGAPATGAAFRGSRLPAEEDVAPNFRQALGELGIREQETLHLDVAPAYRFRGAANPAVPAGGDRVVLQPAAPAEPDTAQVVLYQDEAGGLSWHFADGTDLGAGAPTAKARKGAAKKKAAMAIPKAATFRGAGGGQRTTFTIPTRTAAAQGALAEGQAGPRFRGPITKVGRKIFKVLAIPVLDRLLAKPVEWLRRHVEAKYRQELVRELTPENYRTKVTDPFKGWDRLAGKRSLLVIHGIFSSTEGMLSLMPRAMMEELHARYEGRVIAFDQLTVSHHPRDNAQTFLDAVPAGGRYEFDILCHSRGGIVARTLTELGYQLPRPRPDCVFPRVFFAGTPNQGSVLADPDHLVDMLDVFTNFITSFPDGAVNYSIEILLGIVKLLAVTSERHLPGLEAMNTTGYIAELNRRVPGAKPLRYAAAAADYQPEPGAKNSFVTGQVGNFIIDRIFGKAGNDLVVPYEGVYARNGNASFPIADPVLFDRNAHVWHTGFFAQPRTLDAIKAHFALPDRGRAASFRGSRVALGGGGAPKLPAMIPGDDSATWGGGGGGGGGGVDDAEILELVELEAKEISPPAARKAREIRRVPQMDFHEKVRAGVELPLPVRLQKESAAAEDAPSLAFLLAPGETQVEVEVVLRAPGFDIIGKKTRTMIVKARRDAAKEEVVFRVKAREPKPTGKNQAPTEMQRELCAEFWYNNACVGAVRHYTVVRPAKAKPGSAGGPGKSFPLIIPTTARTPCDLCLTITGIDEPDAAPFLMLLYSDTPGFVYRGLPLGKFKPDTANQPLSDYLTGIYQHHFDPDYAVGENALGSEQWTAQFNGDLDGLGIKLWQGLPKAFRDLYLRMYEQKLPIRSILISSSEMVVPWELITPQTEDGKILPPFGQSHILGRWKPGLPMRPEPQRFRVNRFCLLNPPYGVADGVDELPEAQAEADDLAQLFPRLDRVAPANLATVSRRLGGKDVNVVHFSGHGNYDPGNADLNSLLLLNRGSLSALSLRGNFASATPFVYLNACHAGHTAAVIGRPGGFIANLLDQGCSGVIAPYWQVEDGQARQFAVSLYQKLLQDRSIGEALQELRAENPADVTFRAFAYFGDPWTKLDFSGVV